MLALARLILHNIGVLWIFGFGFETFGDINETHVVTDLFNSDGILVLSVLGLKQMA